jgi:hypothetical protein
MKKTYCILIIFYFALTSASGQLIEKDLIDRWILKTFLNSVIDSSTLYIVNGYPFASDSVNEELNKFKQDDLFGIDLLDHTTIETANFIPRSSIVILAIGTQSRESIKKEFKKVKHRFTTTSAKDTTSREPVLTINNHIFSKSDCYKTINSIGLHDIKVIYTIERSVSVETYGPNGENGLIVIIKK